jgi:hypothetical protein
VLRAALLSIVLTMVVGPNASLLCAVWCHPDGASQDSCEHRDESRTPGVTANDSCGNSAAGAAVLARDEMRRGTPASDGHHAVVVPPYQFLPPSTAPGFAGEPRQYSLLEARPLVLALRI